MAIHASAGSPKPDSAGSAHALSGAAQSLRLDSTFLRPRLPAASEVARYRAESDFDYHEDIHPPDSFFAKVIYWIRRLFNTFFHNDVTGDALPYILFGAAVLFVIWKLIGADKASPFTSGSQKLVTDPALVEEDIHAIDFDAAIEQAIAEGRHRRAVRLTYLKLLKQLTDRGVIHWRIDKTNRDYLNEVSAHDIRLPFAQATRFYEYVWYGDFPLDAASFAQIRETFAGIDRRMEELG